MSCKGRVGSQAGGQGLWACSWEGDGWPPRSTGSQHAPTHPPTGERGRAGWGLGASERVLQRVPRAGSEAGTAGTAGTALGIARSRATSHTHARTCTPPTRCRIRVIHELRQLVEQKEQFIALMSHELRTPLNGIIGLSNVLMMDAGTRWCLWLRVLFALPMVVAGGRHPRPVCCQQTTPLPLPYLQAQTACQQTRQKPSTQSATRARACSTSSTTFWMHRRSERCARLLHACVAWG